MSYIERKKQIIDFLNTCGGSSTIKALCKNIYFSKSTIRRDLISLEEEGIIDRHHGGVSLIEDNASEYSINMRRLKEPEKKASIAKTAKQFLHDNMVLFLDSSSTVSYLIPFIKQYRNVTVVTNGIHIASQLNTVRDLKCYICPGVLKHRSLSIVGEYTSDFLKNFSAEITFFSCKAINQKGIFEGDDSQAMNKRAMLTHSDKKILLCDNTKEFSHGYFKLTDFSEIDTIVSNDLFSEELMTFIEKQSCSFLSANPLEE